MSKELTPFELPEDYKFVYKIKGCENKFDIVTNNFDINPIVEKILSTRAKKVDEEIIKQLKNIGKEYGINELILIDESKVLKMIKSLKVLEIIKETGMLSVFQDIKGICYLTFNNTAIEITKDKYEILRDELL